MHISNDWAQDIRSIRRRKKIGGFWGQPSSAERNAAKGAVAKYYKRHCGSKQESGRLGNIVKSKIRDIKIKNPRKIRGKSKSTLFDPLV